MFFLKWLRTLIYGCNFYTNFNFKFSPPPPPPHQPCQPHCFFTSQYGLSVNQLMAAEGGGGVGVFYSVCVFVSKAFKWEVLRRHVLFSSSFLFDFILHCFICRPLRGRWDRTQAFEGINRH
jgi:hypothetical protein